MHNQMYIPKTITVGFQKRSDTFTGKLAYIIYTDHTGKLRKAASWNSWRDDKIEALTFDNTPQPGFTLNKGVKRDGHWGSGRSMIRVWDPRDFEFEISVSNLIGVLMHADVSKRDITEPCVFAWWGTDLILLPTNSVEYQESVKHTEKQVKKFSSKDLKAGYTYEIKKEPKNVVYLGLFEQYEPTLIDEQQPDERTYYQLNTRFEQRKKKSKAHVFYNLEGGFIETKSSATAYLANVISEEIHGDFPAMMDKYYGLDHSQLMVGLAVVPFGKTKAYQYNVAEPDDNLYTELPSYIWKKLNDTDYLQLNVNDRYDYDRGARENMAEFCKFARLEQDTMGVQLSHQGRTAPSYYSSYQTRGPRHLTGLSFDTYAAEVAEMNKEIRKIWKSFLVSDSEPYNVQEKQRRIRSAAIAEYLITQGYGELKMVYADGKTVTNHKL